jgi:CHAT domain
MTSPSRLVFELSDSIAPDGTELVEIALKEPRVWGSPRLPFRCRGDEPAFLALTRLPLDEDAVQAVGQTLYRAIAAHPDLAHSLTTALRTQPPARYPVFVEIDSSSRVEMLPWEALCDAHGNFLGLDERWAIGRIVDGARISAGAAEFAPPLKLAVVLSCLGVPAADEWQALLDSIRTVPTLPVELLVLASEDDLAATISETRGLPVTVEQVPPDTPALQARIGAFDPHVLHFFCHGSVQGSPHLELAVRSDWVSPPPYNSLFLEAAQIRDLTPRTADRPWLLVLNCCETAAGAGRENLQSLALMLVRDAALPAVVGMREPVASSDASLFTRAFYGGLLGDLSGRLTGTVRPGEPFDWTRYVVRARERLRDKYRMPPSVAARSTQDWTLPVVYTRPEPFVVTPSAAVAVPEAPGGEPSAPAAVPGAPAEEPPAPAAPSAPAPAPPPPAAPRAPAPAPPAAAPGPQPPPPDPETVARSARLEADLLRGLLAQLPPGTPEDFRADIEARLRALGAPAVETAATAVARPAAVARARAGAAG